MVNLGGPCPAINALRCNCRAASSALFWQTGTKSLSAVGVNDRVHAASGWVNAAALSWERFERFAELFLQLAETAVPPPICGDLPLGCPLLWDRLIILERKEEGEGLVRSQTSASWQVLFVDQPAGSTFLDLAPSPVRAAPPHQFLTTRNRIPLLQGGRCSVCQSCRPAAQLEGRWAQLKNRRSWPGIIPPANPNRGLSTGNS